MNIRLRQNPDNEKQHVSRYTINSDCDCIHFNRWVLAYSALTKYKIGLKETTNTLFLQETKKRAKMKGRKGSETKALIRKTAFQQFLSKDYSTVPLKDIEACLHLTRGCMSYHYPSKQELFIDVIDYYILKKQDVENKIKEWDNLSLLEFINYYIKRVEHTMEYLSSLLLPHVKNNCTRAYMSLILQAEDNYPGFAIEATLITKKEILLWEKILKQAQKKGEIQPQWDCKLLAKQFKYVFYGLSYSDSLEKGLDIPSLKEQFMLIYNLIKR